MPLFLVTLANGIQGQFEAETAQEAYDKALDVLSALAEEYNQSPPDIESVEESDGN